MDVESWFDALVNPVGRCRICNRSWINGFDGENDPLLDEGEVLLDCQPVKLTMDLGHGHLILGEWCHPDCFQRDIELRLLDGDARQQVKV